MVATVLLQLGKSYADLPLKCLAIATRHLAIFTLTPLQLGVGVKGGCEAIIHATSHTPQPALVPLPGLLQCIQLHQQGVNVCGNSHSLQTGWSPVTLVSPSST